jgi:hypothetical protein
MAHMCYNYFYSKTKDNSLGLSNLDNPQRKCRMIPLLVHAEVVIIYPWWSQNLSFGCIHRVCLLLHSNSQPAKHAEKVRFDKPGNML